MKYTPTELAQILGGSITDHLDARKTFSARVTAARNRIWKLYFAKHRPKRSMLPEHLEAGAQAARAEWIEKHFAPTVSGFVYLSTFCEGNGPARVVGVFTDEKLARAAGKKKNWYGGDCGVEKHRVNAEIVYGESSEVLDRRPKRKKRAK